ncbi:MAG: hypothetical protein ACOC44_13150 [Promethearchaeia archaeon]
MSKVSIGIGTGFFIVSVFFFPFPLFFKILLFFQLNFVIGAIGYIRANSIQKECKECEYEADWEHCPGMKRVVSKLYQHGFKKRKNSD